jgi:hypothetical protein
MILKKPPEDNLLDWLTFPPLMGQITPMRFLYEPAWEESSGLPQGFFEVFFQVRARTRVSTPLRSEYEI